MENVLIIDDHSLNRKFLVMLLESENYHLLEAENGIEALQIAKREPLDLIITDILMPTMDGYELVEELHKIPVLKNIPIIFYTATYRSEEAKELAESCGVHFVLEKPADPQLILDTVQQALNITKETKQVFALKKAMIPMGRITKSAKLAGINNKFSKNIKELEYIKQNFKKFIDNSSGLEKEHDLLINNIKELSKKLNQYL